VYNEAGTVFIDKRAETNVGATQKEPPRD
jgi:hypothetical protein